MAELQRSFKASSLLSVSLVLVLLWLSFTERASMAATGTVPVGVILDLTSPLGYMVNHSITLAVQDHAATKIHLVVQNVSQNDVVGAKEAASYLIEKEKVRAILGPQNSEQARYIVKLGEESQVPVIWLPITGPSLLPPPSPSSMYSNEGLNCFQFQAIAATISALGWQSIAPIYEETEYGSHLVPCLTNVLKDMDIRMANVTSIDSNPTDFRINTTLDELNNTRTRVFLVHMSMDLGTRFILSAKAKEMMGEGYAWILTQELSTLTDPRVSVERRLYNVGDLFSKNASYSIFNDHIPLKRSMQGALGVRPMDLVSEKTKLRRQIERNFSEWFKSSLTIYGWWAYHTVEALAMALEKPDIDNGQKLRTEIGATNFKGASGVQFDLRNGQLNQSKLEVYNVIGDRERIIGYWSPETRLVQKYNEGGEISGKNKLTDPLWPGDTLDKPPKLRIGVLRTNAFPELVYVGKRNSSDADQNWIDGFAINVFLKAVAVLPFQLNNYGFFPLRDESGRDATTTYDDILCRRMKGQDLDAIIGDITIVESRTECVDFTFPYLDSSVAMVVRITKASTSKGILLKPFKWSLWLILGGIFVAATVIIIILERNKTKEFRFNPFLVYKIDVMEINSASKAAGWMVILTSFLFILVLQVYTANLTSILTQGKEKEPSFEDETEIKSRNLSVGYRTGSWVEGLLINQIGFKPSQLKALGSREEYNETLSKGTKNGGVDAIFDETPYLTLFLSKYKSGFMMTGPIYKTGGFAFAFPKKSSLVPHFSKAILKVTQDMEPYRVLMARNSLPTSIEDLEFEDQNDIETTSLSVANFGGLYPVLLSVVALFLGLAILNPSLIERLPAKLCRKSA